MRIGHEDSFSPSFSVNVGLNESRADRNTFAIRELGGSQTAGSGGFCATTSSHFSDSPPGFRCGFLESHTENHPARAETRVRSYGCDPATPLRSAKSSHDLLSFRGFGALHQTHRATLAMAV
jgi:hypothetical protein